jgi:diguanylate cyclase (GGDEF)-like protein
VGIRGQFLLLLLAVGLGVASTTAVIAARAQRASLLEERKLRGLSVLRSWSSLCRERVLSDESMNLPMWDFIDGLMRGEKSVREVYLLDGSGIYLMHNQQSRVGLAPPSSDPVRRWKGAGSGTYVLSDTSGTRIWFQQSLDINGRHLGLAGVVFAGDGIEEGIQESVERIFLFAAFIALAGVLVGSLLVYQVTRPIHLLVEGVQEFGTNFDPERPETADVRIEFRSFNEIGDVRDSFNDMTSALRRSMAEKKALKEESGFLRMQATTDALTGLYNKRQFEEDLPELVGIASTRHRPLCLMMMDMDRFKQLNDTLGHAAGDQALQDLAQSIRDRTRTSERAYRLGGDEFIVISVGAGMEDARAIADRISEDYHRRKAPGNETAISFGIVSFDGVSGPKELLEAADKEMYRVKRAKKAAR